MEKRALRALTMVQSLVRAPRMRTLSMMAPANAWCPRSLAPSHRSAFSAAVTA